MPCSASKLCINNREFVQFELQLYFDLKQVYIMSFKIMLLYAGIQKIGLHNFSVLLMLKTVLLKKNHRIVHKYIMHEVVEVHLKSQ